MKIGINIFPTCLFVLAICTSLFHEFSALLIVFSILFCLLDLYLIKLSTYIPSDSFLIHTSVRRYTRIINVLCLLISIGVFVVSENHIIACVLALLCATIVFISVGEYIVIGVSLVMLREENLIALYCCFLYFNLRSLIVRYLYTSLHGLEEYLVSLIKFHSNNSTITPSIRTKIRQIRKEIRDNFNQMKYKSLEVSKKPIFHDEELTRNALSHLVMLYSVNYNDENSNQTKRKSPIIGDESTLNNEESARGGSEDWIMSLLNYEKEDYFYLISHEYTKYKESGGAVSWKTDEDMKEYFLSKILSPHLYMSTWLPIVEIDASKLVTYKCIKNILQNCNIDKSDAMCNVGIWINSWFSGQHWDVLGVSDPRKISCIFLLLEDLFLLFDDWTVSAFAKSIYKNR